MGVQGLWTLLAPAGKKIKLETLAGQRLAIDASIWILHIIHGYISSGKKEFRKVHLIGIFKRLVKLLTMRIKPVFVFDGQAPDLKRQTLILRHNLRERRKKNLKKLAERYIVKRLERSITGEGEPKKIKQGQDSDSDEMSDWEEPQEDEANIKKFNPKEKALLDFEFDSIIEDNIEILKEEGWDQESFRALDIVDQYEIIRKIKERMYEKRYEVYLSINILTEYSKFHINERLKNYQQKKELNERRRETYKEEWEAQEAEISNLFKFYF